MRILVVTAHPDDVDFGAGGTVASWTDEGHRVEYCLVTRGEAGGFDASMPRADVGRLRLDEQRAAAAILGVTAVHDLGFSDGAVEPSLALRREISAMIRTVKPDRVLTQSPERRWDRIFASHPDHLATGEATMCAVYPDARNEFAFPELLHERGLEPHTVGETWVMGGPSPRHAVDVTAQFDRKLAALACHASQHGDPAGMRERVSARGRTVAEANGLGPDRMAEAFLVVATA
jgi:LmbE family N-acetylglucosaminyl deacetylase